MSISVGAGGDRLARLLDLHVSEVWPDGNPVATEATWTPVPRSASAATGTSAG